MANRRRHIAILGSVGVPACYGGFETLAAQLAFYHSANNRPERLSITCSGPAFPEKPARFAGAELTYLPLRANGAASVPYDMLSLLRAKLAGADVALLLGVSGALALPFLRHGPMPIIAHIDGREWQRAKWSGAARKVLRMCEGLALRHADAVIADSPAIADDLWHRYGRRAEILTYGGDQAAGVADAPLPPDLPSRYALSVCRIEPENNIEMLLKACIATDTELVCVGNWDASAYGRDLRHRFGAHPRLQLRDPIYAPGPLQELRRRAHLYLHGHSAGGTNPSLVEMMHVGRPILAFDCIFNRQTTHGMADYFGTVSDLVALLRGRLRPDMGPELRAVAQRHYRWESIGAAYFDLFERVAARPRHGWQTAPIRGLLTRQTR